MMTVLRGGTAPSLSVKTDYYLCWIRADYTQYKSLNQHCSFYFILSISISIVVRMKVVVILSPAICLVYFVIRPVSSF